MTVKPVVVLTGNKNITNMDKRPDTYQLKDNGVQICGITEARKNTYKAMLKVEAFLR